MKPQKTILPIGNVVKEASQSEKQVEKKGNVCHRDTGFAMQSTESPLRWSGVVKRSVKLSARVKNETQVLNATQEKNNSTMKKNQLHHAN